MYTPFQLPLPHHLMPACLYILYGSSQWKAGERCGGWTTPFRHSKVETKVSSYYNDLATVDIPDMSNEL
jgi:hypothetical protein